MLNVMKSVNTPQAGVGDTLTYTILIQNTGTVPATNIVFKIQFRLVLPL